jgi:SAM-dependent methyltransferase
MSGFDAKWLDLREPVDLRSRNEHLAKALTRHFHVRRPVHVLDLGCGTGANLRATAPLLGPEQHWTLVDHDQALLEAAVGRLTAWAVESAWKGRQLLLAKGGKRIAVRFRRADLARDLDAALDGDADLVTASALFDLVSADFIAAFAAAIARHKCAFYTVLTYNGLQRWTPKHAGDSAMAAAFRTHQTRDKGFGESVGPMAPGLLATAFDVAGYSVTEGDSAWRLEAGDETLTAELVLGFVNAVRETGQVPAPEIVEWLKVRRTGALVGHTDTLALPG